MSRLHLASHDLIADVDGRQVRAVDVVDVRIIENGGGSASAGPDLVQTMQPVRIASREETTAWLDELAKSRGLPVNAVADWSAAMREVWLRLPDGRSKLLRACE